MDMLVGRRNMPGLKVILSGLLGAGVTFAGSSGYLAKVGPVPLRFQTNISNDARVVLPPLRTDDSSSLPPASEEKDTSADPAIESTATRPAVATENSSPVLVDPLNQVSTNSVPPASGINNETNAVISPQMLLRFFQPSGSGARAEAVVVVPPVFSPPRPVTPVSSSATYTSPKQ